MGYNSYAQKFNIKTYSVNEGLPSGNVFDVQTDDFGYLWFATSNGIVKYDGKNFKVYGTEEGLKDALVYDFHIEEDGEIWVSTEFGGVAKFDGKTFEYLPETTVLDTMVINYITNLRENELWFATNEYGVAIWDQKNGEIRFITEEDGLPSNQIWNIKLLADNEIWITTMYGVAKYDLEKGVQQTITQEDGLSGELTYEVAVDQGGRTWIATSNGVTIIQPNGEMDSLIEVDGEELDYVYAISVDKDGIVWIGTERRGLVLVEPDGKTTKIKRQNGLSSNFIFRIIQDDDGTTWVATDGNGISVFKDRNFMKYDLITDLKASSILALELAKDGTIWIGTENGLSSLKENAFKNYAIPKTFFDQDEIWDIEELPNGDLLLLTYTYEFFQFDGERFFHPDFIDEFTETFINDIYVDDDGSIWVSAFEQLSHINNGEVTHYIPPYDRYWQLNLGYMYRDSRGVLWIASDGGLAKFENGEFEYFTEEDGIPGPSVYEIIEDEFGNLWIGTNNGIAYLKAENVSSDTVQFISFFPDQLYTRETVFLLFDDNQGLWQGTNAGINYFDLKDWDFLNIPRQLHFPLSTNGNAVEFNGSARVLNKDGTLWFGTNTSGLVSYNYTNSRKKVVSSDPPKVFLRQILANHDEIYKQQLSADGKKTLSIDYSLNDVTFLFNAIDYRDPLNISLRYKLNGYDEDWNYATDISEVRYTNLPSGNYTLQVSAKSIKSEWSENIELAAIKILKPFYLSIPFFASLFIGFVVTVFLFISVRIGKIEKRELQKLVDKQTSDLSIALAEKEVLIKEIHHRVKNNLAVVSGLLELQGFRMQAGSAKMAIQESKMRVIAMSKIHENLYQNHDLAHIDFKIFISELIKSIQATMDVVDKNIEVVQYMDSILLDVNMGIPLGLITNELLSNSYKHAFSGKQEGVISIHFKELENEYELTITDDGIGAPEGLLEMDRKSLGISLINSLTAQINGDLQYRNNEGSTFELLVPKDQSKQSVTY